MEGMRGGYLHLLTGLYYVQCRTAHATRHRVREGRPLARGDAVSDDSKQGDWSYDVRIDAQPWMVRLVRDSLGAALRRRGRPELADTAALLVSEVASNGVIHTGMPVTVRAQWQSGRLWVVVHDESPVLPTQEMPGVEAECGRGLVLVDEFAKTWGVRPCTVGSGKVVWFELS
jgi:anti-sigma regulatory factor (Ser/Thr protein kinase)